AGWKINNIDIPNNALYILNGKEVPEEIAAKITEKNVADFKVLKGNEAITTYGAKAANGAVLINTKPGYEIRTWKSDTIMIYRNETMLGINKKMLVIVDGTFYYDKTLQQVADELGISQFETILLLPPAKAITRYGDKGKDGAVLVTLKNSKDVIDNPNILREKELQAQQNNMVFTQVEVNPQFTGGDEAWRKYLRGNLKATTPLDEGWKAGKYTVTIKFIVHTDGTVSDITTENYQGTKTANHCIDVIKNAPKWQPAVQNGRKVNAYKKQPITFVIE
ncbi:MAG: energy transducer TonB, partial [Ferruginibacter sp.]